MRKPAFLLLLLALAASTRAQTTRPHPDVPAAMDVAGLHLEINEAARTLIQQKADALCRHQPSFQARVDLADGSFPIIDKVLQQEGVPLDFRYLVLQESALRGDAQSIHEAVGYWQMKKGTATDLGLLVNEQVDERRHLTASTRAAARYLSRNNANLRNWMNALLSYNTGPGGVKAYVLPTDKGATEMSITEQTSPYVLMFLAHCIAFEPACGMNPKPPLRLQEFPAVPGQSLAQQADIIYADPAALAVHNRWLLAPVVPADRPYTLIVPITDAAAAAGLAAGQRGITETQLITAPTLNARNKAEVRVNNLRALVALPNESKEDLARRGGVKLGHFLRFNELRGFDNAIAGRPYFLQHKRDVAAVEYHVVQANESVADVAQKYGIRQHAIQQKNHLAKNEELRPGRVLWLQHTRPRSIAVEYRNEQEGIGLEMPVGTPRPARPVAVVPVVPPVAPLPPTAEPAPVVVAPAPKPTPTPATEPSEAREIPDAPDVDAATEALNSRPAVVVAPPALPTPRPLPPTPAAPLSLPPRAPLPTGGLADEPEPETVTARPTAPKPAAPRPVASKPAVPAPTAEAPAALPKPIVLPQPAKTMPPRPAAPVAAAAVAPAPARPAAPVADTDGKVLVTYQPAARPAPGKAPAPKAPIATPATAADELHRVVPGETVYGLARQYEIKPADLLAWNNLPPNAGLSVGQLVRLRPAAEAAPAPVVPAAPPAATKPTPAASKPAAALRLATTAPNPALYVPPTPKKAAASSQHTVVAGETLYSISRLYEVKVESLKVWNNNHVDAVKVGEVLRVKAP
ncbi:LysM peptidoglycan-binding domain-containing protein [Hymenobacter sp. ASUV-10]|uniref:LysM peptidoglycan-binding domain-containing protein n=1 Tax=Hymenobacter aranciens TaxID=3063996 RepID=A0ABT9BDZ9_9BACT|nr:LysM peptidoglycan-binding domain-containing protein [Hymenobacter sp. ASUV-10]MDO7876501.1 LysM peptidoglycan-binding domain-containing protein [Hymenobacter sp. ASUV-10]